jgi:hypothetical protein
MGERSQLLRASRAHRNLADTSHQLEAELVHLPFVGLRGSDRYAGIALVLKADVTQLVAQDERYPVLSMACYRHCAMPCLTSEIPSPTERLPLSQVAEITDLLVVENGVAAALTCGHVASRSAELHLQKIEGVVLSPSLAIARNTAGSWNC